MIGKLLMRGLIVGLLAGLLAFPIARIFGGPPVESAIAIEEQTKAAAGVAEAEPMVTRDVQRTVGLGTGLLAYGAGIGGIVTLVVAFAVGRVGSISPERQPRRLPASDSFRWFWFRG